MYESPKTTKNFVSAHFSFAVTKLAVESKAAKKVGDFILGETGEKNFGGKGGILGGVAFVAFCRL